MKNPSDAPPKANGGFTIYIPPKLASVVLALMIGSGAGVLGGFKWVNGSPPDSGGHKSDLENRDLEFNVRFESIERTQGEHTQKIKVLDGKTNEIKRVQIQDISRTEARRITENIKNRSERERQYDRILNLNVRRLRAGKDPCDDVRCWE